jgi:hypothetical protein
MLLDQSLQNSFIRGIENYVLSGNGNYIEGTLVMCEKYGIEPQIAAKFLTQPIIEKIKIEGIDINILKKNDSKLPI